MRPMLLIEGAAWFCAAVTLGVLVNCMLTFTTSPSTCAMAALYAALIGW